VAPVVLVVDHRRAQRRRQLGELRALAAQRPRGRRQLRARQLAARHEPRGHLLGVVAVEARGEPPRRAVVVDHVDPRGVGHLRHEQRDEPSQRLVDVRRAVGDARRVGEQHELTALRLGGAPRGVGRLALARAPDRDGRAGHDGDERQEVARRLDVVPERADGGEQRPDAGDDRDVARPPAERDREHRQQVPGAAERAVARGDVDHRQDRFRG
jgi:hypothetical protein